MKRYVPGGAQEAAEILISLSKKPHIRFHFEYDAAGEDLATVRYDITDLLIREIEEEEA